MGRRRVSYQPRGTTRAAKGQRNGYTGGMAASPHDCERNRRATLDAIDRILDDYQARGFWGVLPLELDLQDGLVSIIRKREPEETIKISR